MRRMAAGLGILVLAAMLGGLAPASADPPPQAGPQGVGGPPDPPLPPDSYIVVLHDTADPHAVANEHSRAHNASVRHVYQAALRGYAATVPPQRLEALRGDPRVRYVEPDGVAYASAQVTPWGITKVGADLSSTLAGNGTGTVAGVSAYVLDTGIDTKHPDLAVAGHVNFAGGPNRDCNGHGTHVAGTVAARDNSSEVVGVAPGAPLTAVKVLGCGGSGSWSGVIAGIDWVTKNVRGRAVANMSLSGGANQAVDDAVVRSAATGVLYALAAGNESKDACTSSPARAGAGSDNGIVTVAATDSGDNEASFSNYGRCVDLWAPGVGVVSTRNGGGTTTMSGTSMASPHVAGGGALYLSTNGTASAAAAETALKAAAQQMTTTSKGGVTVVREHVGRF